MKNKLYKMYWIRYETTFGIIWNPVKQKYGNYFDRGHNSRVRKWFKNKL